MALAAQQDYPSNPTEHENVVPRLRLRLYVAGQSPNSMVAAATLRALIVEFSSRDIELETIDVLQVPQRAQQDGVLHTPMLTKLAPLPAAHILGNLSDRKRLLSVLGLEEPPRK